MPHKYTTKDVLERIREQIAKRTVEINRIRSISRKDRDGIDSFIDRCRQLLDQARKAKDTALDGLMEDGQGRIAADGTKLPPALYPVEVQERMALIFRGEEKAFEAMIDMFDNPDRAVEIFVEERNELQKQLEYYEKLPVADE